MWLGGTIICILSAVAIYYQILLRRKQKLLVDAQKAQRQALSDGQQKNIQSIRIIARAYRSGQVESAEACLRLAGLMDVLGMDGKHREPFAAIDKMREAIAHIPTHAQWKALSKADRKHYEQQIAAEEKKLKDFILQAIERLERHDFNAQTPL